MWGVRQITFGPERSKGSSRLCPDALGAVPINQDQWILCPGDARGVCGDWGEEQRNNGGFNGKDGDMTNECGETHIKTYLDYRYDSGIQFNIQPTQLLVLESGFYGDFSHLRMWRLRRLKVAVSEGFQKFRTANRPSLFWRVTDNLGLQVAVPGAAIKFWKNEKR